MLCGGNSCNSYTQASSLPGYTRKCQKSSKWISLPGATGQVSGQMETEWPGKAFFSSPGKQVQLYYSYVIDLRKEELRSVLISHFTENYNGYHTWIASVPWHKTPHFCIHPYLFPYHIRWQDSFPKILGLSPFVLYLISSKTSSLSYPPLLRHLQYFSFF